MIRYLLTTFYLALLIPLVKAQSVEKTTYELFTFGEGGQIKMLYDRRQRPQSVFLNGKVYLAINADGEIGAPGKSKTKPIVLSFDVATQKFSDMVTVGPPSNDHHDAPVIWADQENYLHLLYGCHKTPGTHLISKTTGSIGDHRKDWREAARIAKSISYPTFYRVLDGKELIYYRNKGHIGSWTYRISSDNGKPGKRQKMMSQTLIAKSEQSGHLIRPSYPAKMVSSCMWCLWPMMTTKRVTRRGITTHDTTKR